MNAFKGIGIQHKKSGRIYSIDGWESRDYDPDEARGIAVGDGIHSLCLYKNMKGNLCWSSDKKYIPDVRTTCIRRQAETDFDGKGNTEVVMKAIDDGLIEDAPAFQWVRETYRPEAYLPAGGELSMIVNNKNKIFECSDLIDGNLRTSFWYPWSSTQYSYENAWIWFDNDNRLDYDVKGNKLAYIYTLACTAL